MFWILSSNSWMQTPQGIAVVNGRVVPVDWFKIVFNPSFPYRFVHMAFAAFLVAALVVAATGAWHLLRGRRDPGVRTMFSMALGLLVVIAPLQILAGDAHGLNTRKYQPAKIAAIEGIWDTEKGGTSLNLFGIPDMKAETTHYRLSVPHLGSVILTHTWDGQIRGLKEFPKEDRPNSTLIFWSFRTMAGLGFLMAILAMTGLILKRRSRLFDCPLYRRFALLMGPTGFISLLAGWITTEAGRQPWVVYGVMRTSHALSPITAQEVGITLLAFVAVYALVFGTGIYYLLRLAMKGPVVTAEDDEGTPRPVDPRKPASRTQRVVADVLGGFRIY